MNPLSILIVDDDDQIREMLQLLLEAGGHRVEVAADGKVASRLIADRVFDLVLTDVLMPERDGLEFIGEVRKIQPAMKIIAMSGGGHIARESYLKIAKAFGANAVLEKPFSNAELMAAVAAAAE
jgi:CheY-like chemotaxis protein